MSINQLVTALQSIAQGEADLAQLKQDIERLNAKLDEVSRVYADFAQTMQSAFEAAPSEAIPLPMPLPQPPMESEAAQPEPAAPSGQPPAKAKRRRVINYTTATRPRRPRGGDGPEEFLWRSMETVSIASQAGMGTMEWRNGRRFVWLTQPEREVAAAEQTRRAERRALAKQPAEPAMQIPPAPPMSVPPIPFNGK